MDVPIVSKRCSKVVKLEIRLHHGSFKVVELMTELYYRSPKGGEANVEASLHGFLHQCELVNGWFYKKD